MNPSISFGFFTEGEESTTPTISSIHDRAVKIAIAPPMECLLCVCEIRFELGGIQNLPKYEER